MRAASQNIWPLADIRNELGKGATSFHVFLDNETMKAELYEIPAGANDMQSPHKLDELYFVIAGRAKFTNDGNVSDVKPGDSIFVKAFAAHRFYDIMEDLSLMVFFSKQEPTQ